MSGILRNLLCLCFVGLMVGSLWLLAASASTPSIPPWQEQDQRHLTERRAQRAQHQQVAAIDPDVDYDVDDVMTCAAVSFDDDEG